MRREVAIRAGARGDIRLNQTRRILTLAMDALVVVAVVVTLHVVIRYFGVLSHTSVGNAFLGVSTLVVPNLGFPNAHSLYGGVFDVNAAVTVIILLVLEWILSFIRSR